MKASNIAGMTVATFLAGFMSPSYGQYGYTEVAANADSAMSVSDTSIRRDATTPDQIVFDIRLSSKAVLSLPRSPNGGQWAAVDARGSANCVTQDVWFEQDTYWRGRGGELVEQARRDRSAPARFQVAPGSLIASAIAYACKNAPSVAQAQPALPVAAATPPARVAASAGEAAAAPTVKSSGTAFAVDRAGHLLTNNHVVSRCSTVTLIATDGSATSGRIQARDVRNDLALITTSARSGGAAVFRRDGIRSGENVVALGYPYRGLLATDVNVSMGIVSAMAGLRNDTSQLQISAPVQPGNSGGPLLDAAGAVAGVVVAKLDALEVARVTGDVPQNINFAIKSEVALLFLRTNGIEPGLVAAKPASASTADHVQAARQYTWLVECVTDAAQQ